ncbi:MAG: ATPase [Planctomycetaceae bacterium]|nr:MAG: ATPase [Planctomycetaceae bacterium]
MSLADQFEIVIPSETSAGHAVQEQIISRLEALHYPPRDVFGMRLSLEEALVNAIKHGNGMDPSKKVIIRGEITEHLVRVEIEDEGPGFKVDEVPDPTADENLERPCGRGIMLMRAFLTRLEYKGRGNIVLLEKHRQSNT